MIEPWSHLRFFKSLVHSPQWHQLPDAEWGSHAWIIRHRYAKPIGSTGPGQVFRDSWWLNDYSVKDAEERLEKTYTGCPQK